MHSSIIQSCAFRPRSDFARLRLYNLNVFARAASCWVAVLSAISAGLGVVINELCAAGDYIIGVVLVCLPGSRALALPCQLQQSHAVVKYHFTSDHEPAADEYELLMRKVAIGRKCEHENITWIKGACSATVLLLTLASIVRKFLLHAG